MPKGDEKRYESNNRTEKDPNHYTTEFKDYLRSFNSKDVTNDKGEWMCSWEKDCYDKLKGNEKGDENENETVSVDEEAIENDKTVLKELSTPTGVVSLLSTFAALLSSAFKNAKNKIISTFNKSPIGYIGEVNADAKKKLKKLEEKEAEEQEKENKGKEQDVPEDEKEAPEAEDEKGVLVVVGEAEKEDGSSRVAPVVTQAMKDENDRQIINEKLEEEKRQEQESIREFEEQRKEQEARELEDELEMDADERVLSIGDDD